ncbi:MULTISPECIES: hypothetical protein [unclassified Marinobacter]|uniref:hypothetical protein n=1 Tax=unclassified Marinobacter TaxID=83889 RepID=UPI00200EAE88|nr:MULTISPECIES: hypothetical protein [unclassified Marinobacter]UQG54167.1 hypothetical protein MIH16_11905 [Marinobacter sp. M4C]UQG62974.1 hypothetical protein MIH17_11910 [Marinobacter sp. M2C]UQG67252.1 hypothetical protein MIH19_11905 [Marinobacter sp. M1C]
MEDDSDKKMRKQPKFWIQGLAIISLVVALVLMGINIYGLTQPIRKPGLGVTDQDQLRFIPKQIWSYEDSLIAINGLDASLPRSEFAEAANQVVNQSLIHIDWQKVNPVEYRQLVPIWENYFLWGIGMFSGLPQFERYHYANYERNIERGIGICGDASTILSSVLDQHQIPNRIVSFGGHVIVEYEREDGKPQLLDPDFGISLGVPLDELSERLEHVRDRYSAAGYSAAEIDDLISIYQTDFALFDNTYHFMTLRYVFENVSYVAKWIVPLSLISLSLGYFAWLRRKQRAKNGNPS